MSTANKCDVNDLIAVWRTIDKLGISSLESAWVFNVAQTSEFIYTVLVVSSNEW